ncbi:unnamed protein product, partial [marine sediment metagenome]
MKVSDLAIFMICLAIGISFASFMGIGGDQFSGIGFFGGIELAIAALVLG